MPPAPPPPGPTAAGLTLRRAGTKSPRHFGPFSSPKNSYGCGGGCMAPVGGSSASGPPASPLPAGYGARGMEEEEGGDGDDDDDGKEGTLRGRRSRRRRSSGPCRAALGSRPPLRWLLTPPPGRPSHPAREGPGSGPLAVS